MAIVTVLLLAVAFTGFVVALVTTPRWFARSLHRHRIWRLRDSLVNAMLEDMLPMKHPAVRRLLGHMDFCLANESKVRAIDFAVFRWAFDGISPLAKEEIARKSAMPPTDDMSDDQRALLTTYSERYKTLLAGSVLLGSWFGIATVLWFLPKASAVVKQQRKASSATPLEGDGVDGPIVSARVALREATDEAASETKRGREYRRAIERSPALVLAVS